MTLRGNGVPRTAYSDEQGTFELAGVAPGTYTLRVSLAGFSDATVENVTVSGAPLALPPVELQLASFGDTVVVTASRNEDRLIDAPVSTSIISAATLETTSAQNYGDLLRATPGLNVIQLSARDVQVTSRSPGNTLTNSQLVLVDGRSAGGHLPGNGRFSSVHKWPVLGVARGEDKRQIAGERLTVTPAIDHVCPQPPTSVRTAARRP